MLAYHRENLNLLKAIEILLNNRENIDSTTWCGITPLYRALIADVPNVFKLLFQYGANPLNTNKDGETTIFKNNMMNKPKFLIILLELRPDLIESYLNPAQLKHIKKLKEIEDFEEILKANPITCKPQRIVDFLSKAQYARELIYMELENRNGDKFNSIDLINEQIAELEKVKQDLLKLSQHSTFWE